MIKNLFDQYISTVVKYPKLVLIVIGILSIGLALGLPNFKLEASAESLTLENDRDLDYFRKVSKDYQSGDFLIVTFKPHDDLFSDNALNILQSLKSDLSNIQGVVGINSILDVPLLYSPKQTIADILRESRTLTNAGVDRELAKKEFLESPIYKNMILGPDGQTTALQLTIRLDNQYLSMVRERDEMRLKEKQSGLTKEEQLALAQLERDFLDYRTKAETQNHKRVEDVRAVVAKYKPHAEIFVGGVTMITADMVTFIKNDLMIFGIAVLIFMVAILAIIFRSIRFVVIPMACCLISVLMMLGFVSWLDWRLTVISSNFVALLLIISLAIIIHLVVRYREYAQEFPNWTQQQLVIATAKFMIRPCAYTAVTTIVAFASLVVSGIRPVIDFGWLMSIGLIVALVLAFLIMPASLMFLPRDKARASNSENNVDQTPEKPPFTVYFSNLVERQGGLVLAITALIAVLSGLGISRLDVENRFIDYFHESTEIYQGLSVIDDNLGGTTSLQIIIDKPQQTFPVVSSVSVSPANENVQGNEAGTDDSDPFAEEEDPFADEAFEDDPFAEEGFADEDDPFADEGFEDDGFTDDSPVAASASTPAGSYWMTVAGMSKIEALHDYLESVPEVGKVQSLATLYKVGRDLNGGFSGFELSLIERSLTGQVRDVLISPYIGSANDQARVTLRIRDLYPDLSRAELESRLKREIYELGIFEPGTVHFTGLLVLYNNMLQSLFDSQIMTLGVVFLCILLMFIVLFRSFSVAVIALLPNILASLSILGFMGLIGLPLDMMTITIAGVTLGIGVDDTIHYIHRFKEEIKKDGDYLEAMHRSHFSIGKAMLYTSVIIIVGFSIMTMSEFIPTIYFGLLTGVAMLAALLASLVLLPKLILMVKPFGVVATAPAESVS